MKRTVYVNGNWMPEDEAQVSIFDRGFLMADSIYEVTCVLHGKLLDFSGHLARLRRSASELGLSIPLDDTELLRIHRELVSLNKVDQGSIYLQLTRGVADRDFSFPPESTPPTLILFSQSKEILVTRAALDGIAVALVQDLRWGRRDIKTTQLLYPSMAKMIAKGRGAEDAWLVENGSITESSAANAYIISESGMLVTQSLSRKILPGITRISVLDLARDLGISVQERAFTIEEAYAAKEAFSTSASSFVLPVVRIDDHLIGNGRPGPLSQKLRALYVEQALRESV